MQNRLQVLWASCANFLTSRLENLTRPAVYDFLKRTSQVAPEGRRAYYWARFMSEKHLTEPPWKTLAGKQGVKDLGLGKALAGYCDIDLSKEPAKAVESLKEISELALKLKKTYAIKEDVVAHLEEMIKEVKKTTPGLESKAKALTAATATSIKPAEPAKAEVEEDDEEKEAADFKRDLKQKTMSALAQVRSRAPGEGEQKGEPKPQLQFMAYVAGKNCSVIVARKVGSATKNLLPDIAAVPTGGKFVQGECIFEKNAHTFVLELVPPGLAKRLAGALQNQTGQKCKVRVRSIDGSVESDSDTEPEQAGSPPPTATPAPAADEMAKFTARLRALQPDILKALAFKSPESEDIKRRTAEAGARANAKDFVQAHSTLDALEGAVRKILAAGVAGPPPIAAKAPPVAPPPSAAGAAPRKEIKLSTYLTGRANLRTARDNAAKELQRLQQAILAKATDEAFFKEIEAKSQKLFEYLAPIDDSVTNKLEEAGRCTDPEKQDELNNAVRELIQKQLAAIRGHPLASFVQDNPFGKFIVRQPLEVTLSALDKQLS